MAIITANLTTDMCYAVVASHVDYGVPTRQHGDDREFWGMRKPPYEAYKIAEVMRSWGTTVYTVGDVPSVNGQLCYSSLLDLPEPIDCVIISLASADALLLVDNVVSLGIKTVWLQFGASRLEVRRAFQARGVRVVIGCVLLHWDVNHVHGMKKGRHVCYMHGNLERVARIRVDADGIPQRIEPIEPSQMPFTSETYGTRLLAPFWRKSVNNDE